MNPEAPINTFRLEDRMSGAQLQRVIHEPVTEDSPAIAVMTDLAQVRAATTGPLTSLRQAEQMMINQGVRMLFVVSDMPAIGGLITSTDISGDRPMQLVNERHVHFDELTVGDVMTPLNLLDAIDLDVLQTATVSNLIATLKRFGRNHLLVVERHGSNEPLRVRGVISRAQIERQLGKPIVVTQIATSFSEIERALF